MAKIKKKNYLQNIKVILCDKNILILKGLAAILEEQKDFKVCHMVQSGNDLLNLLKTEEINVDVVVCGWEFPDMSAREILQVANNNNYKTKILIYSARQVNFTSMNLGAVGYLSKTKNPEDLPEIIRLITKGYIAFPYAKLEGRNFLNNLSTKEFQILELLTTGMNNKKIAKTMIVSENTVKFHLKNLYEKLGVNNRTEAANVYREKIY